jgi:transposase-like protein
VEMLEERGLSISHTTIMRWVHQYGPELDKRIRRHLEQTNDSWRVDETYIKVKGQWMYLYRAVDSKGNTIDFFLNKTRDQKAAKRFFKKASRSFHVSKPRVITVDKNPAYPIAIEQLKKENILRLVVQTKALVRTTIFYIVEVKKGSCMLWDFESVKKTDLLHLPYLNQFLVCWSSRSCIRNGNR